MNKNNKLLFLVFVVLLLGQLTFLHAEDPTLLPDNSHFVLTVWDDPTSTITKTGVRGMKSSVLATRQGIFGIDLSSNVSISNDTFGLSNSATYATELTDAMKDEIIEIAGEDGLLIKPYFAAGANLQIGIFGFGGRAVLDGQGYLTQDLLELILKGNQLNKKYNIDPNLKLAMLGDTKAQVAFRIPLLSRVLKVEDLAIGIAYHHIPAGLYATVDSELSYTPIFTDEEAKNELVADGDLYVSKTVKGSALDVGIMVRPVKKLYLAASIDGLLGKVHWTDFKYFDIEELAKADITNEEQFDALGKPVAGEVIQELPLTVKVGARFDLLNWFKLFGEAKQTRLEDKTNYYNLTVGTDMTLLWVLPLKASLTYDTRYSRVGYNIGAGLKLLFLETSVEAFTRPNGSGDELGIGAGVRVAF